MCGIRTSHGKARYPLSVRSLPTPSTSPCFLFKGPCVEERDVARAREEELFELLNEKAVGQCNRRHSPNKT